MRNNIFTIFKKELDRVFKDRKLVFSIVILPGLMIYIMYSIMGNLSLMKFKVEESYRSKVYVSGLPSSISEKLAPLNLNLIETDAASLEQKKEEIKEKTADLIILFSEDFDREVEAYEVASGKAAPKVELFFNSSRIESRDAYDRVEYVLNEYETSLSNKFDLMGKKNDGYDLASKEDVTGMIFGSMLPMLLMIFMWSACISVAPESIAGEKERGTIATLLITPARRSDIALGKVFALSFIALLSGASSFLGTFLSLPKLFSGMGSGLSTMTYSPMDYVMLFFVILSTVVLMVTVISVISAFAKSVKEAATLASPVMIVIIVVSILPGIFGNMDKPAAMGMYLIPLYSSVLSLNDILKFHLDFVNILLSMVGNLVMTVALTVVLERMFNSEKIMFAK